MDKLAELNHGAKVVLGSAIALLIVSFFHWFTYGPFGENMWHGIGVIAGLLVIALIAWQAIRLANIDVEIGVTPAMITAVLAVLTFVFVLIRFIDKPGSGPVSDVIDRSIWAWLGLILAIVLVAGAWANMKLAGESLTDMKDRVAAMARVAPEAAPRLRPRRAHRRRRRLRRPSRCTPAGDSGESST